ncbi:hypothetical protein [Actinomadura rudentiformis]|uniref:hypothetical protein n=1 Tax=Actinomadura rudentiformis TaxID=359158 RepID=UPI00178C42FA|nr:hypothetical protein [Actinomadura rudentiformis]
MAVYATPDELTAWLDSPAPPTAVRLLRVASQIVDEILIGAIYDTDADDAPTDPNVAARLREATCAQAAYLLALGDDTGATTQAGSHSVGGVSASRAQAAPRWAPQAVSVLRSAGLVPVHPVVPGRPVWWPTWETPWGP